MFDRLRRRGCRRRLGRRPCTFIILVLLLHRRCSSDRLCCRGRLPPCRRALRFWFALHCRHHRHRRRRCSSRLGRRLPAFIILVLSVCLAVNLAVVRPIVLPRSPSAMPLWPWPSSYSSSSSKSSSCLFMPSSSSYTSSSSKSSSGLFMPSSLSLLSASLVAMQHPHFDDW